MLVAIGDTITMPEPERDGYTFDYWEGSEYYAGDEYTVEGDHTFTAKWIEDEENEEDEVIDDQDEDDSDSAEDIDSDSRDEKATPNKTGDETPYGVFAVFAAALASLIYVVRRRREDR